MSAADYICATFGCAERAVAVRQTTNPTAFYGECGWHVKPLTGDGDSWLWAPPGTPAVLENYFAWVETELATSSYDPTYGTSYGGTLAVKTCLTCGAIVDGASLQKHANWHES